MKLKNRAITALILSIILLGVAVLIWANQTGKISIWGAGGVVTIQDLGWQNTPTTPNSINFPTTCPGNSVATGIAAIGLSKPGPSYVLKCGNVLVDGKVATKQQHGQVSPTNLLDAATGKGYQIMVCPTGTFMDSYYSSTITIPTSTTSHGVVLPSVNTPITTPTKINCVTLTETTSNWSVSPAASFTDIVFAQGLYDPVSLYPGAKCVNTAAIGFKRSLDPLSIQSPYHIRCSSNISASGGPAPTPIPIPTPIPTPIPQDTTAPTAPINLKAELQENEDIMLTWTASTDNVGVKGYKIYNADTNELIATTAQTTYTVTGTKCQTIYRYFVVAYDANGNHSNRSNVAEATTPACDPAEDTEKPTTPANLKYSNLSATGTSPDCWTVDLIWNESTDNIVITGYDIYNADNNKLITTTDTIGHKLTGLKENTKYSYYIKAHDAAGNVSDKSNTLTLSTSACPVTPSPTQTSKPSTSALVSTGGALWFNILVAILISGIATYFLLKKA